MKVSVVLSGFVFIMKNAFNLPSYLFIFLTEQIRLKNIRKVYGRCMWYRLRLLKPQPNIIPTVK